MDSLDWKDYGVDAILNNVLKSGDLKNGSIIRCHNGAKYTAQALERLITGLEEQGYEIVPVSRLIYRERYHLNGLGHMFMALPYAPEIMPCTKNRFHVIRIVFHPSSGQKKCRLNIMFF